MVSENVMQRLHNAIQIYDDLVDKDYLIICSIGKKAEHKYYEISIQKQNFWHLLGCKLIKGNSQEIVYDLCLSGENIREFLEYTNNEKSCIKKDTVFNATFNFIKHAKQLKVCDVIDVPEEFQFKLASGNSSGYIGYDKYKDKKRLHYPKTTRTTPISETNFSEQKKILAILSKPLNQNNYDCVEYEIAKDSYSDLRKNIPDEYEVL